MAIRLLGAATFLTAIAIAGAFQNFESLPALTHVKLPTLEPNTAATNLVAKGVPLGIQYVIPAGTTLYGYGHGLTAESEDGGTHWETVGVDPNQLAIDKSLSIVAEANGSLYVTKDRGEHWQEVEFPNSMFGMDILLGHQGFYFWGNEFVYLPRLGANFELGTVPFKQSGAQLFELDEKIAMIRKIDDGDDSRIDVFVSSNHGLSWKQSGSIPASDGYEYDEECRMASVETTLYAQTSKGIYRYALDGPWVKVSPIGTLIGDHESKFIGFGKSLFILDHGQLFSSTTGATWSPVAINGGIQTLEANTSTMHALVRTARGIELFTLTAQGEWKIAKAFPGRKVVYATSGEKHLIVRDEDSAFLYADTDSEPWVEIRKVVPDGLRDVQSLGDKLYGVNSRSVFRLQRDHQWRPLPLPDISVPAIEAFYIGILSGTKINSDPGPEVHSVMETVDITRRPALLSAQAPSTLLFSFHGNLMLSADGGREWQTVTPKGYALSGNSSPRCAAIAATREAIYAVYTRNSKPTQVLKSEDLGKTWLSIGEVPETKVRLTLLVDFDGIVYLATDSQLLRKSPLEQWRNIAGKILFGPDRLTNVSVAPNGALIASTRSKLWWSPDKGESWLETPGDLTNAYNLQAQTLVPYSSESMLAIAKGNLYLLRTRSSRANNVDFEPAIQADFETGSKADLQVKIDGVQSPGFSLTQERGVVRVRGDRSISAQLADGVHSIQLSAKQTSENLTLKSYVFKEKTEEWFGYRPYGKSYALVIAVSDYSGTGFPSLPDAIPQAKLVADALSKQGFEVTPFYGPKATRDAIEAYLLNSRLTKNDRLLVYFGGHGHTVDGATNQKIGYLVTAGVKKENILLGLPMARIETEYAQLLGANHVLFVLDACFSGLAATRSGGPSAQELAVFHRYKEMKLLTEEKMRAVLAAGRAGDEALDLNGGIFTKAFLAGITGSADYDKNGVVTLQELYLYVQDRVLKEASINGINQVPQLSQQSAFGAGQFLFLYR